jgi:DNA mismatch endonuclease (patch repair protein)
MPDTFTPQKRSDIMARIKGRDTKPEKIVRSLLHQLGYRFRLQRRDLPGNPDIVLPRHKKAVLVHGCFWHGHKGCPRSARPRSNEAFWNEKLTRNIERDRRNLVELQSLGWRVLVIWQCEIKNTQTLIERLRVFLKS